MNNAEKFGQDDCGVDDDIVVYYIEMFEDDDEQKRIIQKNIPNKVTHCFCFRTREHFTLYDLLSSVSHNLHIS